MNTLLDMIKDHSSIIKLRVGFIAFKSNNQTFDNVSVSNSLEIKRITVEHSSLVEIGLKYCSLIKYDATMLILLLKMRFSFSKVSVMNSSAIK